MSLQPMEIVPVPDETARVARAAFPKGNVWLSLRDELGTIYCDGMFADLYPRRGQPAEAPWRLALVLVMQFADALSDRQAAEAVRSRIDWKYALALESDGSGFRQHGPERVPHAPGRGISRAQDARCCPGSVPGKEMGNASRASADRLDPCARHDPRPQPAGMRW